MFSCQWEVGNNVMCHPATCNGMLRLTMNLVRQQFELDRLVERGVEAVASDGRLGLSRFPALTRRPDGHNDVRVGQAIGVHRRKVAGVDQSHEELAALLYVLATEAKRAKPVAAAGARILHHGREGRRYCPAVIAFVVVVIAREQTTLHIEIGAILVLKRTERY